MTVGLAKVKVWLRSQEMKSLYIQHLAGRQQYQSNTEVATVTYYRVNYSAEFTDHILHEFGSRFNTETQVGLRLLSLLPAHSRAQSQSNVDQVVSDLLLW